MLLSVGMLVIATTQILTYYLKVSDLIQGLSFCIGIGLLITSIIGRKPKHIKTN